MSSIPKKFANRTVPRPLYTSTRPPPPWSGETAMSAAPSPSTSPSATYTPPLNAPSNGLITRTTWRVAPSVTITVAVTPGPVPVTTSGTPSPVTSATATRTPVFGANTDGPPSV